jgi:hypothetical protein
MNKLLTCVGLAAVGAATLHAQFLGEGPQKSWDVSARVRGFYDDNYATLPSNRDDGGPTKRGSWGATAGVAGNYNPSLSELTTLGAGLRYDAYFYEDRPRATVDHNIQANARFGHQFSERYKLDVNESFVLAQEPYLLDPTAVLATPLRSEGNNWRNTGSLTLRANLTKKLSSRLGYTATVYDYEQTGDASRSALLDRMEHLATVDLRWEFRDTTMGLLGYQFGLVDQTSRDLLYDRFSALDAAMLLKRAVNANPAALLTPAEADDVQAHVPSPDIRDNRSHYLFVGADHNFTTQMTGQIRAGIQYTEYPNALAGGQDSAWGPYVDVNLSYNYAEGCRATVGVRQSRNQTDVAVPAYRITAPVAPGSDFLSLFYPSLATPTLDQASTTIYASVNQKITAKLNLLVRGQWQDSKFNQGAAADSYDNFYSIDAQLSFEITKKLFAEAGYAYDRLDSDLFNRGFARNRLFLGARMTL